MITGLGTIAANGIGPDAYWDTLVKGQSGIGYITLFDARDYPIRVAGEVKGFNLHDIVSSVVTTWRMARHTQFAVAAAHMALDMARLDLRAVARRSPLAIIVGVSTSAFDVIERGQERMHEGGPQRVSAYFVEASQPHGMATMLARTLGVQARCQTISSACASGMEAIASAAALIRTGKFEVVITGGADATVTPLAIASFTTAGMLPSSNGDPTSASRPFDLGRCGGVVGEGSAMFVLESLSHALARGAEPLLELHGYGSMIDEPGTRPASGLAYTMEAALANSARHPDEIEYICAHGPSDKVQDEVETDAIKSVLGKHARDIPISSIKGVIGNPLAACGPLALATCALAVRHQTIPPTANYSVPDPKCDLDYVPINGRPYPLRLALINVHGMGGMNGSMLVEAFTGA
ncbi:MAG: beta-ketoacyl-[acyl-carrier-protein] synthase family protein [Verrucomicrobia bacterium]|nr:beta-ketoacyl-[acyl-carrier-protein] synthase family protein [Verrucomicrobiota bacterium]